MNEKTTAPTTEERAPLLSTNYFAVIPAAVFYDLELTANEKLFYGVLSALSQKEGYCWANNERLAACFSCGGHEISPRSVERWLATLKKRGHIRTQSLTKNGKFVGRRIYLRIALPSVPDELEIDALDKENSPRKNADTPQKHEIEYPQKCGTDKKESISKNSASALFDAVVNKLTNCDEGTVQELRAAIDAYCEMRRKKRAPLSTTRAVTGIANKLIQYSGGDIQAAIAVLDYSTEGNYTGVFPLKNAQQKPADAPRNEETLW